MQVKINPYYHALTQFDSQNQYLRIDKNNQELILCDKVDLNWIQRFSRWFWKPQNERISYIAKMIFDRINNDMFEQLNFEQLNSEAQNLTHFFQQLGYLSEKADKKHSSRNIQERTIALQRACFKRMGMLEKASEQEPILESQQSIVHLRAKKSLIEVEIESKKAVLKELSDKLSILKAETDQETTNKKDIGEALQRMSRLVAQLSFQRDYLQSDTVLWCKDGYVLCHSSCFSKQSMLHSEQFQNMVKRSTQVEQKLIDLEEVQKEVCVALKLIPKQICIESANILNLKRFVYLIELGPNLILDCVLEDELALKSIADFLQQPLPDLKTPFVKELERKIATQNEDLNAKERKIARQERELNAMEIINTRKNERLNHHNNIREN